MTRHPLPRTLAVLALAAVGLTGCAAAEPAADPTTPPTTTSAPPAAEPVASETEAPEPTAEPTCDTIIPAEVVADLEAAGWSFREDVFRIGAAEVDDGITCTWGDMSVASDHVQMFGWAPLTADQAAQHQSTLLQEGWVREDGGDGIYLTETPDTVSAPDEQGYGWTFLFGDDWVTFADTKQGLLLVEWPKT